MRGSFGLCSCSLCLIWAQTHQERVCPAARHSPSVPVRFRAALKRALPVPGEAARLGSVTRRTVAPVFVWRLLPSQGVGLSYLLSRQRFPNHLLCGRNSSRVWGFSDEQNTRQLPAVVDLEMDNMEIHQYVGW